MNTKNQSNSKIHCVFWKNKRLAILTAFLIFGTLQAAVTPANAEMLTMPFDQAASPSTTLLPGDVYQEGNMQIEVTGGSISIAGAGSACTHGGSGCLNVLSTTATFELSLVNGDRFKLKAAPSFWAEHALIFDASVQVYSDTNRATNTFWSFCDSGFDSQRTSNPSPPVDCPEGDFVRFIDQTVRASYYEIVVETPSGPALECQGFMAPFDTELYLKKKVKRAIPIKLALLNADGFVVTDLDIAAPPVINVTFDGSVYGEEPTDAYDLLPLGSANVDNVMRYDPDLQLWVYNLGTKQFAAGGDYTVEVISGDDAEYTIPRTDGACSQTFTRLN